ncbi:Sodium/calcium exchanger protein-domain-containing protein [Irpex rosettiformis]|uniref:Sodium/calcium exchanger protein-domain-containing protein n=1 Tax=Irpex rosettiformis TaxID=378272 RepID=A0ACB8UB72_9APHY|nr:Sodium/calcium exchanger protein-domain-containing protein [Irpex rosettiformis]
MAPTTHSYYVTQGPAHTPSIAQTLRPSHAFSRSQSSAMSSSSTTNLMPHESSKKQTSFFSFSCWRRKQRTLDSEKNDTANPTQSEGDNPRSCDLMMGWKLIFFGSWLNVLILLVPVTWILRLVIPESPTIIFAACLLAMIPLVRLHDSSVRELSIRIGGSKTGLLNASMSNIVESVIAIIALRKCELRVVQSSLIGAMLSKLLLILGMCFFAGGMRFTAQDFDSTATQIHSSLLSLSVGAVLLPAAFHFTLSYRTGENVQTSMEEQKKDILRMSHGVSIVLIFIYIAYLLFQFWSHSHHFEDAVAPSHKLPNAVSMRSMASRVRPTSPALRKFASPSSTFASVFRSPRAPFMANSSETALSGPYMYRKAPSASPPRTGILMTSPLGTTSQLTVTMPAQAEPMYAPNTDAAASTVRLVSEAERASPKEEVDGVSPCSSRSESPSPSQGVDRASFVSDLVSTYYTDMNAVHERPVLAGSREGTYGRGIDSRGTSSRIQLCDEPKTLRRRTMQPSDTMEDVSPTAKQPQLSLFLTLVLLLVVTVIVALNAEWMIDSIDSLSPTISKEWIALILLPTVGSLAECITATNVSVEDQLTLSISVAVGSTIQTALFVIPFMVLLGWVLGKPLALLFDPFESIVLYISVHTMGYVVADGKSNWLEGLILIGLYIVAAVAFWFYPGSNFSSTLAVCSTSAP